MTVKKPLLPKPTAEPDLFGYEFAEKQWERQAVLTKLLDWHHEFLKEKGLVDEFWKWKIVKKYVKPEGGFV